MAKLSSSSSSSPLLWRSSYIHLLFVLSLAVQAAVSQAKRSPAKETLPIDPPPLAPGLAWFFYSKLCPDIKDIIRTHLEHVFKKDITQAAGLLRLHFHDCFVQGCEGSLLLDGSEDGPGEKTSKPNFTIRKDTYEIIEELREIVHLRCGKVVSCTDLTALAARDAVFLSGGPDYEIPLGRRDGLEFATENVTMASLPSPMSNTTVLLSQMTKRNMTATDLVAISGAHTIGRTRCMFMASRLFPHIDPTMDEQLATELRVMCPDPSKDNHVDLDLISPTIFDNSYFVDLKQGRGIFTSDQDLYTDNRTKQIVLDFASDQDLFFAKFVDAMVKLGQLGVLTGDKGQIRDVCSVVNGNTTTTHGDLLRRR